ncbi:hypothetical protein SO802_013851 [Lithocarpus litseifolius]|uniref:Uncharacterized protein n=1 Tax=Lithocarpus litseifolius TaxID=425828 RepID=A0AAW2DAG4_9ROSI
MVVEWQIGGRSRALPCAMPGKMVQCLKTVGTANPLVLIDGVTRFWPYHFHIYHFPGFYRPVQVKAWQASYLRISFSLNPCFSFLGPKLLAALQETYERQAPCVGAFLVKDEPGTDPSLISSIRGDRVILIAHGRLRITKMDKPYNKDDDVIKATSFQVKSTIRDVLNTSSCWRDDVEIYTQVAYLEFPPGTLDKHYEKFLQCDPNLLKLSQRPFPNLSSPYFHTDCYNGSKEFSLDFYRHGQLPLPFSITHLPFKSIQQIQAYEQAHQQYLLTKYSTSPISVMDFSPHSDEAISNQGVDDPRMAMWYQRMTNPANVLGRDQMQGPFSMAISTQVNPAISGQNYNVSGAWPISDNQILDDIQSQLLSDDQFQFDYDP